MVWFLFQTATNKTTNHSKARFRETSTVHASAPLPRAVGGGGLGAAPRTGDAVEGLQEPPQGPMQPLPQSLHRHFGREGWEEKEKVVGMQDA